MKILFVCMGNICRSPAAEATLRHHLKKAGLNGKVTVDSAGTINYHAGKPPDARMLRAAGRRGITLDHHARQVARHDLRDFDLILVMDADNLADVKMLDPEGKLEDKIKLFAEFFTKSREREVPDPYHGGEAGFELVLDLLDDGCAEIVRRIQSGTLLP